MKGIMKFMNDKIDNVILILLGILLLIVVIITIYCIFNNITLKPGYIPLPIII